jgi:nitrile hydratase
MSDESPQAIRAEALESILIEKGLLTAETVDDIITRYSERVGPMNGARLVARAWVDPQFKKQLLTDATSIVESFGFEGGQVEKLVVVENTDKVHNAVVCTLCSCYPWAVLGLPPKWYKDPAYRSRIVMEPRQLLAEMGVGLGSNVEIQVWDSSAEIRYMVLPMRPPGTQNLKEEQLAELVTRDSMIGVEVLIGVEVPGELS